jgi:putative ABC transport system permease protein
LKRYLHNLTIALEAVFNNRARSSLTALGIIFGVAAVIAMMAIGRGSKQEILEQIKLVGVNNIIIKPIVEDLNNASSSEESEDTKLFKGKFSPGLTINDVLSIETLIPTVSNVSPEVIYQETAIHEGKKTSVKLTGVTTEFFDIFSISLHKGKEFNKEQIDEGKPVCIITPQIESKLFNDENPVGKFIKCGVTWYKVIAVVQSQGTTAANPEDIGLSDYNNAVFVPINTLLLRHKDRSLISTGTINSQRFNDENNGQLNLNQLDRIVVQVKESEQLKITAEIIDRMLLRRHSEVKDFEVIIPEFLLKQQERTKNIMSIVLVAIASISLIVGGIGIMNIMLASVMERTREIGVRRAIGATKQDVIMQFLSEATFISVAGGIIGILLGFALAWFLENLSIFIRDFDDIPTIVSFWSIAISFVVSVSVGIIFGYLPARRAAEKDPVISLRYE